jgi:phosphate transport system substrate-binding protein
MDGPVYDRTGTGVHRIIPNLRETVYNGNARAPARERRRTISGRYSIKRTRKGLAAGLLIAVFSAAVPAAGQETVRIGGTGAGVALARQLAAAFELQHPGYAVQIAAGLGSTGGIAAVAAGALDIGVSSRPLRPDEMTPDIMQWRFARTPMVLAANRSAAVSSLTMSDVLRIYRGEMTNWPNGERVRLVLRPASYNEIALITGLSPDLRDAMQAALRRTGMLMAMTDQENADLLRSTPGAVGFTSLAQIFTDRAQFKALAVDGVRPLGSRSVNSGYPYMKDLYLAAPRRPSPAAARFLSFLRSRAGERVLRNGGAVPVRVDGAAP